MCRSFLLFRGALMNKDWIDKWSFNIGNELHLQGCTSTSRNLDVALGFSKCDTDYAFEQQPVLFVFSMLNQTGFSGFRLTDKRYSIYPQEQEYLLCEGFPVYIIDVQERFEIKNDYKHL